VSLLRRLISHFQQAWVALFQFFLGILLAPLNSLPFLQDAYVPFTSIPSTISNGGRCLAGLNSIVNHTVVDADGFAHGSCWLDKNNKWGAPSDSHCDDCVGAWLPTFPYIVFKLQLQPLHRALQQPPAQRGRVGMERQI